MMAEAVRMYQDPAAADETKVILHKTIESVLERGQRLDDLVAKSEDLSMASQMFYKQARKTNSCCTIM
jgi:synaptobrevin homolog YKT6